MLIFADLHIHSKYSRGTSGRMDLEHISENAKIKGLNLVGTGDFTHPGWLSELKEKLEPLGNGLYRYNGVLFVLTVEVSTIYEYGGKTRKIHHVILAPDFETVEQLNDIFGNWGSLESDGRPVFNSVTSPELVEAVSQVSSMVEVIPAHAWTPWFSLFGSRSGFNSLKECYQDMAGRIHALETGLSSDPPMNWRVSELDRITLLSNSDAHSPWPFRLGRELNVFNIENPSYAEIIETIRSGDPARLLYTIEVDPSYGKYHFDGHRNCGVSLHPRQAMARGNICPICGKPLTIGVLHRVEELADRPEGYIRKNAIPYKSLIPLQELIALIKGSTPASARVGKIYMRLIEKFGSELNILLNAEISEIAQFDPKLAKIILDMRIGKLKIIPGYDGVYGKLVLEDNEENREVKEDKSYYNRQSTLSDYI